MRKLMLGLITFAALGLLWLLPGQVSAMNLTVPVTMGGNGTSCEKQGYLNPTELSFHYNDRVTIQFKNEQATALQVRNVPGGSFVVQGHQQASRTFQAKGGFTIGAWANSAAHCEKATTLVKVQGGWWIRLWPWILAVIGSGVVIWLVSRAGKPEPTA